jgi:hypothetical protein
MLATNLQQRFDQLLSFAKNPDHPLTAHENIAAARELIDTVHMLGLLTPDQYFAYHQQIGDVRQFVIDVQHQKHADEIAVLRSKFQAHTSAVVSDDGAYRFNPLTGQHE